MPNKGYKQTEAHRNKSATTLRSWPRKHHRITNGYRELYIPESGRKNGWVREHVWVMSTHLGRAVKYPENVHHIDGDKLNNSPENLILCENVSEHTTIHHSMELVVCDLLKKGLLRFDRETKRYVIEEAVANLWLALH